MLASLRPPESWRPHLGEILDPPLNSNKNWSNSDVCWIWINSQNYWWTEFSDILKNILNFWSSCRLVEVLVDFYSMKNSSRVWIGWIHRNLGLYQNYINIDAFCYQFCVWSVFSFALLGWSHHFKKSETKSNPAISQHLQLLLTKTGSRNLPLNISAESLLHRKWSLSLVLVFHCVWWFWARCSRLSGLRSFILLQCMWVSGI